ncbi:Eco57I restriction-modification methylase domain-containing protein [Verrucomicrobiota bacterium]
MSNIPKQVEKLVGQFDRNIDAYKSPEYNETQLRVEFVNPFWKVLGWDMTNEAGYAMTYRDVVHEDAVKVGTATKAPDYCFRIGGMRKFFLETKRPALNLKNDPSPAFQLRRYGWSAKLPMSILTDFEEMIVYDCRIRPKKTDKAAQARVKYIRYSEYTDRWDEIESVFSREAVLKGSFDKFTETTKGKRGTAEVDTEFLKEIEGWRAVLASNIALRNPSLSKRDLNFAVHMTIDRIIFLRMCEDRGIEKYGQLQALCGGPRIYQRLTGIYQKADERYNSGLFHFQPEKDRDSLPDELTPKLIIDDKVLKAMFQHLYYPDSPYEFRILPPEILGNVYEQFLGKVIELTAGHHAKVEEKPEVRKAGGVYYTPSYIVNYIVKNTVGKLCEGKTPKQVSNFRILDPACGSGSFLIGAYQYLLDWHLKYYLDEMEKTGKVSTIQPKAGKKRKKSDAPVMFQGRGGDYLLTTVEKKRILLNNIYGVDIDTQAVEVTKLSLLLKVLENENQDTLQSQLSLWRERALPDLSSNIKCGNSLIGPDFYEGQQMDLFDEEEKYRINAFDWHDDNYGFGEIMRAGGFDAVIGIGARDDIQS